MVQQFVGIKGIGKLSVSTDEVKRGDEGLCDNLLSSNLHAKETPPQLRF